MLSAQQIAAQADFLQAKRFLAQLRAEREHLAGQLSMQVTKLNTGPSRLSDEEARSLRGAIRYLEANIRQLDRMLEGLERRFPEAVSR